jgi:prepilin-type N-terminal cleavage/methylation domain-containing protein
MKLSDKGFTLAELLLAAAILAFVLSSLLLVFINCIILNESSRNLTVAVSHAEFALEEIKHQDFSSIASSTWDTSTIVSKGLIPLNSESLVITATGMSPKNINATVNWRDRAVRNRSATLKTLLTEP